MKVICLLFLVSFQISAISLTELYQSYQISMSEEEMPELWKVLGSTVNRFSVYCSLGTALNENAEYQKRIESLNHISTDILLPLLKFPNNNLLIWQQLICGERAKLNDIKIKPLPPTESFGFDFVDEDEATDQSDPK